MILKANVVAILAKEFGIGDFNLATRDDKKMANALKTMLDNSVDWDEFEVINLVINVQQCQFDGCEKISFINCAFCDQFLCFDHFSKLFHFHEV